MRKCFLKSVAVAITVFATHSVHAQVWESITNNLKVAMQGTARAMESDGTRLYVVTLTNGIYVSADNGSSFTPINDVEGGVYGMTNKPGRFIKYANGSMWVGWDPGSAAIAGTGPINYGAATLHRLTPGETVWHKSSNGFPIADTGNQADDLAYDSSTGTYYVAAALGGAFVSNDGSNWQQRATGLGGVDLPVTMVAFDGMAFMSRGLEQVQRTTNQGTNWTSLQSQQGYSTGLMIEKNKRLMFISNGPDRFNYSDDHGNTWLFTTNGIRQLGDLSTKDGLIYGSGIFYGSALEPFVGRPGFKFSATEGISWDNLPTNGLPMDQGFLTVARVLRQNNYLFCYFNINGPIQLYRCDVSSFDFRPTTQIVNQPPATNNFLTGQTINLSVLAGGTNLTYQWSYQGATINGANGATYSIPLAQTNNSGTYTVVVTGDRGGSVTSSVITVNVGERRDGKYDITYNNPATGGSIYLCPDGSLVSLGGVNFYRMNPTGERAVTRNYGGANFQATLLDSSNLIVMAGRFTAAPRNTRVIRAYATNLVDEPTFHTPTANADFTCMAELPGRGYLLGGTFTTITNSGIATNAVGHVCLINYSGVVDTNFLFTGATSVINKIVVADKTNIFLASGTLNGFTFNKINLDGSVDTNFSHAATGNNVSFFQPCTAGKLFAVVSSRPILINLDGTLDGSFNTANATFNNSVTSIAVGESNKIYVVGTFTNYGGKALGQYARLFADGTVDTNFYAESPVGGGLSGDVYDPRGYLYVMRDSSGGSFQGQSYGTGPYRLFAGTNNAATSSGFDTWAAQFTFPPGKNNPQDDADGDGLANVFEFYFGSNPTSGASGKVPTEITVNNGGQNYPALTFIRSKTASGVTLISQASTSLTFGGLLPTTVESVVDLGNGTEQVTIRSTISVTAQPYQFLRILLSVP